MIDYDKHTTMTSGRDRWLWTSLAFLGAGLVWFGLGAPLVQLPVVGSVRFFETSLGGRWLGGSCVAALALAAFSLPWARGLLHFLFCTLAMLSLGLLAGSCLAIYRLALIRVEEFSDMGGGFVDEGIGKVMAAMEWGSGTWAIAGGALCTIVAWGWASRRNSRKR